MARSALEFLNSRIDGLIARGQYREALAVPLDGHFDDTQAALLCQINLAEAEYNLGQWDLARERLRGLDVLAAMFPIARAGLAQQRAWIAAHAGDGREALRLWQRAELADLPRAYHAEHFFTGAVALLALGDLVRALRTAQSGARLSVRPSSKRNALFIEARIAATLGDLQRADTLCRAAADHPWHFAGGDGLLFWGDLLRAQGKLDEARTAWILARDRDPQSESAHSATARLAA